MSITGILLLGGFVVAASLMVARILPALLALPLMAAWIAWCADVCDSLCSEGRDVLLLDAECGEALWYADADREGLDSINSCLCCLLC